MFFPNFRFGGFTGGVDVYFVTDGIALVFFNVIVSAGRVGFHVVDVCFDVQCFKVIGAGLPAAGVVGPARIAAVCGKEEPAHSFSLFIEGIIIDEVAVAAFVLGEDREADQAVGTVVPGVEVVAVVAQAGEYAAFFAEQEAEAGAVEFGIVAGPGVEVEGVGGELGEVLVFEMFFEGKDAVVAGGAAGGCGACGTGRYGDGGEQRYA